MRLQKDYKKERLRKKKPEVKNLHIAKEVKEHIVQEKLRAKTYDSKTEA